MMASRAKTSLDVWQDSASWPPAEVEDNTSTPTKLIKGGHHFGLSKKGNVVLLVSAFLGVFMVMTAVSITSVATLDMRRNVMSQNEEKLPKSSSNNSSSTQREMSLVREENHTSSSMITANINVGRAEQEKAANADPREVVKTRPYNNKKVAYISYGSFHDGQERFQTTIIASLRTWLKDSIIFYVLINQWKTKFEEACNDPVNREECKRIVPIFVDCPEGYYGRSPCCKMDHGMLVMWENYSHYDFYSYQDDDMYIRTEYMDDFLSGLSPDEPMVLTCKSTRQLGNNWDPEHHANCSKDIDFMYPWGQPAMYSRAGLERMSKVFQMGGVTKQCIQFDITHDVGNPIVHWMVGIPEVRLPEIPPSPPDVWNGMILGAHGVGRQDRSDALNQTVVHALTASLKHPQPPYEYKWHRPNGFLQTNAYKMHGNVSEWTEWHTMNISDCRGPAADVLAS